MLSFKLTAFICACFVAAVLAAPTTDSPAGQTEAPATTTPPQTPAAVTTTTTTASPVTTTTTQTASASSPEETNKPAANSTSPMPVSASHDAANSTTFSCYGRQIGYYADPDLNCSVYHFCLQGDFNGESVFQRISYLCLNETVFDQQALDCVDKNNVTAPCKDSAAYYDLSNQILRKTIISGGATEPKEN